MRVFAKFNPYKSNDDLEFLNFIEKTKRAFIRNGFKEQREFF